MKGNFKHKLCFNSSQLTGFSDVRLTRMWFKFKQQSIISDEVRKHKIFFFSHKYWTHQLTLLKLWVHIKSIHLKMWLCQLTVY